MVPKKVISFEFELEGVVGVSLLGVARWDGSPLIRTTWSDGTTREVRFDFNEVSELSGRRITCGECGKRPVLKWNEWANAEMYYTRLCRDCFFWIQKMMMEKQGRACVRIGHEHFVCSDSDDSPFRGYGGRAFRIEYFDGRIVETTNLWSQGTIPERFWDRLPDNAVSLLADVRPWGELNS